MRIGVGGVQQVAGIADISRLQPALRLFLELVRYTLS